MFLDWLRRLLNLRKPALVRVPVRRNPYQG